MGTLYCIEAGTHNADFHIQNMAHVSGCIVPGHPLSPTLGPTRHLLGGWGSKRKTEGSPLSILTIITILIISGTPSGAEEPANSLFFSFHLKNPTLWGRWSALFSD